MTQKFFETDAVMSLDDAQKHYVRNIDNDLKGESQFIYNNYYDIKNSSVRIINNKVLDFIVDDNGYHGGAHGWHNPSYYCYDLAIGAQITIDTLFNKGSQAKLISMLKARPDDYDDERDYKFKDVNKERNITHLDNFILLPKGIIFVYTEYEIGMYAEGQFKYTVKYSEIKHLLKPSAQQYFISDIISIRV